MVTLQVRDAKRVVREDGELVEKPFSATAIPYAKWNNRGNSPMSVWLGRDAEHVRPILEPTFTSEARVSASFARGGMDLNRLKDQQMPRNATDGYAENFDFWPHLGGSEWITYEFGDSAKVIGSTLSWFTPIFPVSHRIGPMTLEAATSLPSTRTLIPCPVP